MPWHQRPSPGGKGAGPYVYAGEGGVAGFYAALRPLGVETEAIEDSFIGFNKLLRRGGVDAGQAAGAYTQLRQAFAAGTLSGDEFNSLRDVPGFMQALAEAIGKPISALKEMGFKGQITSEILVKMFRTLADSSVPPLNAIERLQGVWDQFAIDVAESLTRVFAPVAQALATVTEGFGKLPQPIQDAAIGLGALAVAGGAVVVAASGLLVALPLCPLDSPGSWCRHSCVGSDHRPSGAGGSRAGADCEGGL